MAGQSSCVRSSVQSSGRKISKNRTLNFDRQRILIRRAGTGRLITVLLHKNSQASQRERRKHQFFGDCACACRWSRKADRHRFPRRLTKNSHEKAEVCKTSTSGFDSHLRLQFFPRDGGKSRRGLQPRAGERCEAVWHVRSSWLARCLPKVMQGCKPLLLCRRPTRIHAGFLPLVPTATVLFSPFEAALPRRTQDAEAICRRILSVEPRHAESLHLLGVFALHAGRHELAEGMIRQAIALSPGDSAFHYNFGHALREQGQMDAAIAAYRPSVCAWRKPPRSRPSTRDAAANCIFNAAIFRGTKKAALRVKRGPCEI